MIPYLLIPLAFMAGSILSTLVFGRVYSREMGKRPAWDLKVTTPEGTVLQLDTEQLHVLWRMGDRSTDGYLDLLEMPRVHLWVKPAGWVEPDRTAALDGTAAARQDLRWS